MPKKYDIIITGSGLTGLLLANFLLKHDFKVALVEKDKISVKEDIRSTAINLASAEILDSMGLWKELQSVAAEINDILILNNKSDASLTFNNPDKSMGYILLNHELKDILLRKIKESGRVDIYEEYEIIEVLQHDNHTCLNDQIGREISARLVVAAQGKAGDWLTKFKIDNLSLPHKQTAITFLIRHEKPHLNLAVEHFLPTGPFATLPLVDQFKSSVIWSLKDEEFAKIKQLDSGQKTKLFKQYMPDCFGDAEIISEIKAYPLYSNFAFKYYRGRILFLGDAIHSMHPLAGQGFNLTILDMAKFILQLSERKSLGFDIGSKDFMQSFAKSIFKDDAMLVGGVYFLDKFFSNNNKICNVLRNAGIGIVDKLPPVKKSLIAYAMGIR